MASVSAVRAVATRKTWWAALLVALALTWAFAPRAGAVLVHWGPKGSKQAAGVLPRRGVNPASIPGSFARHSTSTSTAATTGNLTYQGGPVLHAESPYLIFWDPSSKITAQQKANLARYFADAAAASGSQTNFYSVDRQFTDATGFADYKQTWASSQAITDTQAYPSSGQCDVSARVAVPTCLHDSQIRAEVARLVNAQGLPTGTSGSAPIYFVVTPPSVDTCDTGGSTVCADNYYCAYHGIFRANSHNILYADMPTYLDSHDPKGCQSDGNTQVQAPNGDQVTDVVTSSMSHEFSETITDPVTNATLGNGGWYDPISRNEDGDNCAFTGAFDPANGYNPNAFGPALGGSATGTPYGTLYDQLVSGHQYYTQTEWSNGNSTCEAQPASAALTAAFSLPQAAAPGTSVALNPSGSSSAAGFTSTSWDFGDTNTSFSRSAPGSLNHTFASAGTYTVKLTVVDAYGNLATISHQITVAQTAAAFTVLPANPQAGASATYDASGSIDTVGTLNSYTWHWDDGSPDSTGLTTTHTFVAPGPHSVQLTVSDGTHTANTTRQVTVDAPPSAAFAVTTDNPVAGGPVSFDGTGSSETNGSIVSYSWDFGDGSSPGTGTTPSHTYATPGAYTVVLTVTDQDGYTAQISHSVVVDSPPIPAFSVSAGPRAGAPASFNGSASNEPGGSIVSYQWSLGDGAAATGASVSHTFASAGSFPVTLTVTDAKGRTASATQTVSVSNASTPLPPSTGVPTAVISVTTAHPIAGATVAFSGSGSSGQGSTLVAYNWSFGDASSATGMTPAHSYRRPGSYTVTLTVRDATGATATTSRRVTVASAGISGVKIKKGKTVARLTLSLSGPGTLTWGKLKFKVQQAGNRILNYKLSAVQRRQLKSHHAVTVSLKLRFSPTAGSASSRTVRFKISP